MRGNYGGDYTMLFLLVVWLCKLTRQKEIIRNFPGIIIEQYFMIMKFLKNNDIL